MFRRGAVILIGLILGAGQTPFQQLHLAQVAQQWSRPMTVPTAGHSVPVRRLPIPVRHDAGACVICLILHAPTMADTVAPPAIELGPLVGYTRALASLQFSAVWVAQAQCRGPPVL